MEYEYATIRQSTYGVKTMKAKQTFQVSVIIPVYNAEKFVARAVESALAQPETAEVILVEDASPDQALKVCRYLEKQYAGKVRLFRHPDGTNHGAGPSRNLGISKARFPFIAFLDADDYYLPGRFKKDAELLQADPSLDGVYNALGTDFVDDHGRHWWDAGPKRPTLTTIWDPPPPEDLFVEMSLVGSRGLFSFNTATFRRRVFEIAGLFSDLRLSQDTLLRMQIAAVCRLAGGQTHEPVAMRGVHAHNRIQYPERMLEAQRDVFEALMEWAPTAPLTQHQRLALYHAYLRRANDWPGVRRIITRYPRMLLNFSTLIIVVRWILFRRSEDDPYLPGIFPTLRKSCVYTLKKSMRSTTTQ